jgi:hypothetical protein
MGHRDIRDKVALRKSRGTIEHGRAAQVSVGFFWNVHKLLLLHQKMRISFCTIHAIRKMLSH